jgi:RpiB/LacA/LacB family sugar-phosphate isomerase
MDLVIGSDHAGVAMKATLVADLRRLQHRVIDVGTHSSEPADYPDYAIKLAEKILAGDAERGVLICGSGVGAAVAANKIRGIRAGLCHDTYSAHQGVEHDAMNVLVLGARVIGEETARELARAFVGARFSAEERHLRRLRKVEDIERRYSNSGNR